MLLALYLNENNQGGFQVLKLNNIFKNRVKDQMLSNKKMSAGWLQASSPITAEIMAKSGFDILVIDMEHGPGDMMSLLHQLHALSSYEVTPFVRVPWNDFVIIKRVLDVGAHGILVPYVNSAEEAKQAVKACKYPPEGFRGIAPSPRAGGFAMNGKDYLEHANAQISLFVAIETKEAVGNLPEILNVRGIDGVFIGPMDLSTSMGYFGNPEADEVKETIINIEKLVLQSDKALATVARNIHQAKNLYEKGYRIVVMMSDTTTLGELAKNTVSKFNKLYPKH